VNNVRKNPPIAASAPGAILLTTALLLGNNGVHAQGDAPDMVIHNAKIVTVDEKFSIAEAAAIKDGRFIVVGTNQQVLNSAGRDTQTVDMQGRTVLPGFNDTHLHLASRGISFNVQVDLTNVSSIADIQEAIAQRVRSVERGDWIFGSRGWWEYELSDGRLPTRHDLDEAAPDNPVAIPGPHYSIANSMALEVAGISRETEDPLGGEIWRDENGDLTGLLMDNASRPVRGYFPEQSFRDKVDGVRKMIARVNGFGLTSVREPGCDKETVEIYRELFDAGELNIRVDCAYSVDPNTPLEELDEVLEALGPPGQSWGNGMFRADGLAEVGLDGAELTALLRRGYPDRPDYKGLEKVPPEQFREFALVAARHGWRLGPHAVGDAAIDQAIAAFEYVDQQVPIRDRRWMIDHAFLLLPDHYQQVKDLGLIINSQYMHNYQLGKLILTAWDRPLADLSENFKDWVDNGILFANGADGPISYHAQPILQIYGSVTRNTGWGGSLGPDQGLSREDAIRSVTINSAFTSFEENVKGSIEPGKYADFVVLSDNILRVAPLDIAEIKVLATVLGGRVIHGEFPR
jgi:predicted amidohydrolase YtcJ